MERLSAPATCVSDRRGHVSKKRKAATAILADLERGILPAERETPAPLNPDAVLDSAAARHAPHLAAPTDIRGAGQSGGTRGAGGAKGAGLIGGGDSSGMSPSDAGGRQTAPSPAAGGSDDDMEGG